MKVRSAAPTRRTFLASAAATGAAVAVAPLGALADPAAQDDPAGSVAQQSAHRPRLKLGFDNFSLRAFNYKAPRLIEEAAALRAEVLLLSDLEVYDSLEADYLARIRRQAEEAGVELQAGTGSLCPTSKTYDRSKWGTAEDHARLLIQTASRLGSSVARCYLGNQGDREGEGGIERHIDEIVKVLRAVRGAAEDANVRIAVENHAGDMQAWELKELIEAAGRDFVGATMDAGNATWTVEDPLVNLEILAPYALTTGIRDTAVWETPTGATSMWANMGRGVVDWPTYVQRFRTLCPQTPFVLEIISYKWSRESNYLEPGFWEKFPRARAEEFARFVALAKRGQEFRLPPGRPAGPASLELEQAQQRFDLEQSLDYCRQVLGLGIKA
jgi:sugar phosphate isomerase/epimerase